MSLSLTKRSNKHEDATDTRRQDHRQAFPGRYYGITDYVERIGHYMPFELVTIPELKNTKSLSEEQQKSAEGELILKQIQPSDTVVLLDEHGREWRSIEFARWLEQKRNTARRLIFVIGGPYGFSPAVYG